MADDLNPADVPEPQEAAPEGEQPTEEVDEMPVEEPSGEETPAEEASGEEAAPDDPGPDEVDQPHSGEAVSAEEPQSVESASGEPAPDDGAPADPALEPPADIDLGPERRTSPWLWVGVAAAVVAVGIIGFVLWWAGARPIAVPEVTGKSAAQATQTLNDSGLRLGKVSEEPTTAAAAGVVVSQIPTAGVELTPGQAVDLLVAAVPERATVPDVIGKSLEEAEKALAGQRLATYGVDTFSATVGAGLVVSQVPTSGALLEPGAYVAVAVSKGPQPSQIAIPDLKGLTGDDAKATVSALGLAPAGYRSFDASVTAGLVATQSPAPGSKLTEGATVQYLISDGPGTSLVTVPSVVGKTRKDAESALKAKGLKPQARTAPSPSIPKDQVISQMPPGNSSTGKGTTVGIVVSAGPVAEKAVPDLQTKSKEDAEKTLTQAGFTPVVLTVAVDGETPGQVFAQFPSAGTSWGIRFPVIALVAEAK